MPPRLLLACAWLGLVACGGGQRRSTFTRATLVAIEIEGTTAIPVDELAPGLAVERARGKRAVDPYQLSTDLDRVRAAYLQLGYFEAKVAARVDTKGFAQTVVFTVTEGPRSTLRVEISGLPPEVSLAEARALVELPDGAPFDYEIYDDAKEPLVKLLEDAGYASVDIEAVVLADRAKRVATARFVVTPNARASFGPITVEGAGDLEPAVRARLEFVTGDVYTQRELTASQHAIYELNRFTTVRVEPDRSQGAIIPVKVTVDRVSRGELRYGGGAGLDPLVYELRARGGLGFIPDALPLWSFGVDLRPAVTIARDVNNLGLQIRATAFAQRIELFRPRLRLETELSYDFLRYEAYTTNGPRARIGLASPVGSLRWLQARVGWLIEHQSFSKVVVAEPTATEIGLDGALRRGVYELSLVADRRDNQLDVRDGWYASMQASFGTPFALGAASYQRLVPEARFYRSLGRVVLALRARAGMLYGTVPVTERFFSGGATSQRGFAERRLSPIAPTTDGGTVVIGGVGVVESSVELRAPLFDLAGFPLVTALFLDAADVVADLGELSIADLQYAVGFGVYLKLFGLKVGASVGERLNRREPNPDRAWFKNRSWHIAVGDTF